MTYDRKGLFYGPKFANCTLHVSPLLRDLTMAPRSLLAETACASSGNRVTYEAKPAGRKTAVYAEYESSRFDSPTRMQSNTLGSG